jgi:cytochrome c5
MIDNKPSQSRMAMFGLAGLALILCASLLAAGCANSDRNAPTAPVATTVPTAQATKGRAQIWGETCARCHNMRSPDIYSDAQWEVAMQHMRVRGYLTGEEHRQILEFLKSAN